MRNKVVRTIETLAIFGTFADPDSGVILKKTLIVPTHKIPASPVQLEKLVKWFLSETGSNLVPLRLNPAEKTSVKKYVTSEVQFLQIASVI